MRAAAPRSTESISSSDVSDFSLSCSFFESLEAEAGLRLRRLAELGKDLLHVLDVATGLPEVSLEPVAELVVRDLADELREHLVGQLLLDVEDVSELVQEELAGIR